MAKARAFSDISKIDGLHQGLQIPLRLFRDGPYHSFVLFDIQPSTWFI